MKKMAISALMVVISCQVLGSSVSWWSVQCPEWSKYSVDSETTSTTITGGVMGEDGAGATIAGIIYARNGVDGTYIKADDYTGTAAPVNMRWLLALYGDVLDASTLPLFRNVELTVSPNYGAGGDKIADPSDFYLVFVAEDWDDYVAGAANPHRWYGWVNLAVNADGALDLLGSDIAVYGDTLIVGGGSAIPEPSGGLLFLLGAAALALRRSGKFWPVDGNSR